ncbi:MAG: radical SAM protein, partial [Nanoarchaeota archaeon]
YHKAHDKGFWINEKAHWWMEEERFRNLVQILNLDFQKSAAKLLKENPLAIGLSISAASRFYSFELMKKIKSINPDIHLILGGKGVWTAEERDYFKDYTDFFVIGEGEETILELMQSINKGYALEKLSEIKGLRTNKYQKKYAPRPLIDLKKLPFPTYDELDLSKYTEKTIGMRFSQGCIANCGFCEDKPFQGHYRTRGPVDVYNELRYHYEINGINHFWFNDLAINGDYDALEKLCDLIVDNNLKVRWICLAIARKDMPKKLLFKMADAGCYTINFGIESGSNSVLKKMNKYEMFSAEDAERIMKWTKEAGINVQPNFIVGYPGETEEEFQETLKFIERNRNVITGITNINTCILPYKAPIGLTSARLGIKNNHPVEWIQGDLTYEVRLDRARRAYEFVKKLGYDVYFSNLSQSKKEKSKSGDRNTDVFLIMCPPWDILMPPLGLAYLASNLKKNQIKTEVLDLNIDLYDLVSEENKRAWHMEDFFKWSNEKFHEFLFENYKPYLNNIIKRIIGDNPILVGLSVNAANYNFSCKLAKILKHNNQDLKICIGGPNSDNDEIWGLEIKNYIDFAVIGEAELIMPEIVKKLKNNQTIHDFPGVLVIKNKTKFKPWHPEKELGKLAPPTFLEFDLKKYKEKPRALPMMASRGCVARCSFCLDWMYRANYSSRPAKDVVDEMAMHINNHGINNFNFRDLVINGNLKALEEICDYIIAKNLNVTWSAQGIVNSNMSDDLLLKMRSAGLAIMVFGVESCSDTVLEKMNKPYRMKHLQDLLPRMHKAGITVSINLIIGYPGEGEKEFMETYNFVKKNSRYLKSISSLTPCLLMGNTNLTKNIEELKLIVPEKEGFLRWHSFDNKNTYEIRKERIKRIAALCKQIGIETPLVNLYDEQPKLNANGVKKKLKILSS